MTTTRGVADPRVVAAVREALGLRAVLRLRRLHLPRGRAAVPVRDPGRVHPGAAGRRAPSRVQHRRAAVPARAAVIILYINIIAAWGWFIGYFVPKLSGDFARLFREAPQLFAKVNKDWLPRAGAWIDTHFGARGGRPQTTALTSHAGGAAGAARDPGRAARRTAASASISRPSTSRCKPAESGKYLIAPPVQDVVDGGRAGKWERSIKQWLADAAEVDRGREPARARVRAEVHRRGRVRHRPPVPGVDGGGVHPDRSRSHPGLPALAGPGAVPGRLRPHRTSASTAACRA